MTFAVLPLPCGSAFVDAIDEATEATRWFLEDHPGRWAAAFVGKLLDTTGNPVYVTAAQLLVETMAMAAEELDIQDFNLNYLQGIQEVDTVDFPIAGDIAPSHSAGL